MGNKRLMLGRSSVHSGCDGRRLPSEIEKVIRTQRHRSDRSGDACNIKIAQPKTNGSDLFEILRFEKV